MGGELRRDGRPPRIVGTVWRGPPPTALTSRTGSPTMADASLVDSLFIAFQQALAGRYSIDREIGRGGMGIVYLAREVHLDRSVAIKLLPPERAKEQALREGFLREARFAANDIDGFTTRYLVKPGGDDRVGRKFARVLL